MILGRHCVLVIIALGLWSQVQAADWSGEIPNGTVWPGGQVQRITGDVTIAAGSTLTVQAGAIVKFNGGGDMFVDGDLVAIGTSGSPIYFTSDKDDTVGGDTNGDGSGTSPFSGAWNKVAISSTGSADLDWVIVRYGGDRTFGVQGAVEVNQGSLTYDNGTVSDSDSAGIRVWSANPTISGLTFDSNRNGGIQINLDANPAITSATFTNNGTNGVAVDGGTLSVSGAWDDTGAVYRLTGDVTVPDGLSLSIAAGQVVKMNGGVDLFINGTLNADGSSGQHITFTSDKDDSIGGDTNNDADATAPFIGAWNKLDVGPTGSGNLTWVDVYYGGDRTFGVQGSVEVDQGALTYANGSVDQSDGAGIRIWSANPVISGLDFDSNRNGGIQMNVDANPDVSNVTFSNNGTNGIAVDGGTLTVDGFWNDPDAVYRLTGDITVPEGRSLTVAAGQRIKVNGSVDLFVNGLMTASGTMTDHVVFTSDKDDLVGGDTNNDADGSSPFVGAWNKLDIGPTGSADFMWVDISYGGDRTFGVQGSLEVDQGALTYSNGSVNFSDSAGIRIWSADPSITGVDFDSNVYGAMQMNVDANPAVSNVTFSNNGTNGIDVDGGTLTVNGFWNDPDAVYRLTADITVPDGLGLTVAADQIVKFNSGVDLFVSGNLSINGTSGSPVTVTSDRDDRMGGDTNNDADGSAPFAGAWNKIDVGPGGQGNFSWLNVYYGGDRTFGVQGAVEVDQGDLTFASGSVNNSDSAGIRIWSATPSIDGLSFDSNWYGGIQINIDANPAVSNVTFSNNGTNGVAVDGGTLTVPGFWDDPDAVYRLTGDVVVPDGLTLTVAGGQIVKGNSGVDIRVEGDFVAVGSAAAPINFSSELDDGVGGDTNGDGEDTTPFTGSWNGLLIPASGSAEVRYASIRYGGDRTFGYSGSVQLDGGDLELANTLVELSDSAAVYAGGGSTATLSNCILAKSLYGIRAVSSSAATVINCTIDGNDAGAAASDAQLGLTNNIVSNHARVGVEQSGSATVTVSYSDVYNPAASQGNYGGLADQTGKNGNLSSDPLLGNPDAGIFSLLSGSPAIDSGTSDGAPLTDLIDNARVDDLGIENIGGGSPNYFDMGALERQKGSDPVDLVIEDVEFSPESGEIGDTVTISWTVRNAGTAPAAAPWSDAIFASEDTQWQLSDERLEVFEQNVTLLPGQSYTETLDIDIPPTLPGTLNFIIRSDYRQQVREIAESNDEVASVEIDIPILPLDGAVQTALTDDRPERYFQLGLEPNDLFADDGTPTVLGDLLIGLDDFDNQGTNEILIGVNRVPTRTEFDEKTEGLQADQEVQVPLLGQAAIIIMARAANLPGGLSDVELTAGLEPFGANMFAPAEAGNNGRVTLAIDGTRFGDNVQVSLRNGPSGQVPAESVLVEGPGRIYATFNLTGVQPGSYNVHTQQVMRGLVLVGDLGDPENVDAEFRDFPFASTSAQALSIVEGGSSLTQVSVSLPSRVRAARQFSFTVSYTNLGNQDAPSPLMVLDAGNGEVLDPELGVNAGSQLLLLGTSTSGPSNVLRPGQSETMELTALAPNTAGNPMVVSAQLASDGPGGPDYGGWIEALGNSSSSAPWPAVIATLESELGTSWSAFEASLGELAGKGAVSALSRSRSVREIMNDVISAAIPDNAFEAPSAPFVSRAITATDPARPPEVRAVDNAKCGFGNLPSNCGNNSPRIGLTGKLELGVAPGTAGWPEPGCLLALGDRAIIETVKQVWVTNVPSTPGDHMEIWLGAGLTNQSMVVYGDGSELSDIVETFTFSAYSFPQLHFESTREAKRIITAEYDENADGLNFPRIPDFDLKKNDNDFKLNFYGGGSGLFDLSIGQILGTNSSIGGEQLALVGGFGGMQGGAATVEDVRLFFTPTQIFVRIDIHYANVDRYEFDDKDYNSSFLDAAFYTAEWCDSLGALGADSPAAGFDTMIVMEDTSRFEYIPKDAPTPDPEPITPPTEDAGPDDTDETSVVGSFDPNDKTGPSGFGSDNAIEVDEILNYTVFFENDPVFASAPAQQVRITDVLDENLDLETLELDSFMFGSTVVQAEAGGRAFSTTVNTTNLDGSPLLVNITAELDEQSRTLTWLFDSIDPETGGPPNGIDDGFLPVNDESGIGEGKVTFRIGVLPDTPVGEVIMNDANIFFDTNAPIMTPTTTNVIFEDLIFISDYEEIED